jgi:tetratricopeptide (TPR) repeat protein
VNSPGGSKFPSIPDHEIVGVLNESEGGITYKARYARSNQLVAVQLLPRDLPADQFQKEARAAAALYHPNIRKVYESGEVEGKRFLSLELIDGEPLSARIGRPLPVRAAAELVEKMADALHYAHGRGIVHGQLCLSSVLLQADGSQPLGIPKIAGFAPLRCSVPPIYSVPEPTRGEPGPGVDIYALGVILYEMLTGRPPFVAETAEELRQQVQSHRPAPPSHIRPAVSPELDTICLRCLEKDPQRRYSSAQDVARALRLFLAGKPVEPVVMGLYRRAVRIARQEPIIAGIVGGLLALFFLLMVIEHLKYGRAAQGKAHTELAVTQAEERAREAKNEAEQANNAKANAEREKAAVRAAQESALAELAKSRQAEKTARENELKSLEREKIARENAQKSRDDEKKAMEEAIQARAAIVQGALAWHRQHAEHWEKAGEWTAAAYHIGKLIDAAPKDEILLVRRADAYRQAGNWLAAVADYSRALELKPDLPVARLRDRCLKRSTPAQAGGMIGLGATGVLGAPIAVPELFSTSLR